MENDFQGMKMKTKHTKNLCDTATAVPIGKFIASKSILEKKKNDLNDLRVYLKKTRNKRINQTQSKQKEGNKK